MMAFGISFEQGRLGSGYEAQKTARSSVGSTLRKNTAFLGQQTVGKAQYVAFAG